MASTHIKLNVFKVPIRNFNISYTWCRLFHKKKPLECVQQCIRNDTCSAVVTNQKWEEEPPYCKIIGVDKLSCDTINILNLEPHKNIWVIERNELTAEMMTTEAPSGTCCDPFTQTTAGCFMVDQHVEGWHDAQVHCSSLRENAHLAEPDTQEVRLVLINHFKKHEANLPWETT